jgi:hypothetical protein
VTVIGTLVDLFDFPVPPEKLIRTGGYTSVDQGGDDTADNLRRLREKHYSSGG